VPTTTQLNHQPQNSFQSVVRESQAAVVDMLRAWTDINLQLTRNLGLPMARIDVAGPLIARSTSPTRPLPPSANSP
jgi:hypothetical protein